MKKIFALSVATLFACGAFAQVNSYVIYTTDADYLSKRTERMAQRNLKHQQTIHEIDSMVAARSFVFVPQTIQQMPDGMQHPVNGPEYQLVFKPSYTDICLPYIVGNMPPYHNIVINGIMPEVQGYLAVEGNGGWTITFQSTAQTEFDLTFKLHINSVGRSGYLTISCDQFSDVVYQGSIQGLFGR